jgi:hypothetical protein
MPACRHWGDKHVLVSFLHRLILLEFHLQARSRGKTNKIWNNKWNWWNWWKVKHNFRHAAMPANTQT